MVSRKPLIDRNVTVLGNHVSNGFFRSFRTQRLLIYLSYMASGGRPTERPVHLTPEQRRIAQERTAEWRRLAGISQAEMASAVLVGQSTYRLWETGRDPHAGPTLPQATQLDQALRKLLGNRYADGQALQIWGWPAPGDMSYERVAGLLRSAGFNVPNSHPAPPTDVLWVHRLQEPNLIHGVFALAAAAATRAGLSVRLLLDEMGLPPKERHGKHSEFESRVRDWFAFAGGHDSRLSIGLYSAILTGELVADRGWSTVRQYLSKENEVLSFLLASKVISPLLYDTDAEGSVLELIRQSQPPTADRLLDALQNWIVFEHEIASLLTARPADESMPVVTLGGDDERALWELWHNGCSDELSGRVQHIYLQPLPMPNNRAPWREGALLARTTRPTLTTYLRGRTINDRNTDLIEWMIKVAIGLPAGLRADFRAGLDPALNDAAVLLRPADETAAATAKAVIAWLNP